MTTEADKLELVGTTVAEKYAIESVVGQGGFATVYRATHLLWKRSVAVKVFAALGEVDAGQRQQLLDDFIREGALLAELSERSAAIVQARDVGMLTTRKGETVPYMVLEWLEGRSLEELLEDERARGAPLRSLEEAVRLLDPVAEALALAHKKGIAHRDVKPANVFVLGAAEGETRGVKLLDFGIAKVVQDAQKKGFGKTAGHITSFTPLYGAPEQFDRSHGATGPWTDVYALALVVAEVVSGREPMAGDNLVQLAIAAADPVNRPTPRRLGVPISDALEAIFLKAVAVSPSERYQTAGELWEALRQQVAADPTSARISARGAVAGAASGPMPAADTLVDSGAATALAPPPALASTGRPVEPAAPPSSAEPTAAPPKAKGRLPIVLVGAAVAALGAGAIAIGLRGGVGGADPPGGLPGVATDASASAAPPASAALPEADAAPACPEGMVAIPGGEFFMGSDEADAFPFEKPQHKVKLSPYCLDVHEVTVAAFKACSDRGACRRAGKENVWPGISEAQRKIYDPLCNSRDLEKKANHPINCVDWAQAREFCEAKGARLPTEAEWEFAARGPDGRIYPWGDDPPSALLLNACGAECLAWQKTHRDPLNPPKAMYAEDDGFVHTAPVGSFPKGRSRYGIEDVVGNVWEWVADWHADYPKEPGAALVDPKGPEQGTERVIRGGSWNGAERSWVRPTFRYSAAPEGRSHGWGFRCARSL